LGFVWAALDHGVDYLVAWWQQRQGAEIVDFAERRRALNAIVTHRTIQ